MKTLNRKQRRAELRLELREISLRRRFPLVKRMEQMAFNLGRLTGKHGVVASTHNLDYGESYDV